MNETHNFSRHGECPKTNEKGAGGGSGEITKELQTKKESLATGISRPCEKSSGLRKIRGRRFLFDGPETPLFPWRGLLSQKKVICGSAALCSKKLYDRSLFK